MRQDRVWNRAQLDPPGCFASQNQPPEKRAWVFTMAPVSPLNPDEPMEGADPAESKTA